MPHCHDRWFKKYIDNKLAITIDKELRIDWNTKLIIHLMKLLLLFLNTKYFKKSFKGINYYDIV